MLDKVTHGLFLDEVSIIQTSWDDFTFTFSVQYLYLIQASGTLGR